MHPAEDVNFPLEQHLLQLVAGRAGVASPQRDVDRARGVVADRHVALGQLRSPAHTERLTLGFRVQSTMEPHLSTGQKMSSACLELRVLQRYS